MPTFAADLKIERLKINKKLPFTPLVPSVPLAPLNNRTMKKLHLIYIIAAALLAMSCKTT